RYPRKKNDFRATRDKKLEIKKAVEEPVLTRHYEDLWGCITRNIGKGFVLGCGGKVSVNLLFILLNALRGRPLSLSWNAILQNAQPYGVFLGLLLGINNAVMYE